MTILLQLQLQLLLLNHHRGESNRYDPARKPQLIEGFHTSAWRLFKPTACIEKDAKLRKQTKRKFNSFNGYIAGLLLLCGDISSHPGPYRQDECVRETNYPCFQLKEKGLKLCHLNVRSLPGHLDETKMLILVNNFDLFAMSETWLNSTWSDPELAIEGYTIHRCDRNDDKGGGTAIYAKDSLICRRIDLLDKESNAEYVCLEIKQHVAGPRLLFIVFYRPPNSPSKRFDQIIQMLETASCQWDEIIVTGDFNINVLGPANANCKLTKIFRDAGMKQLISTPTRESKGTATLIDHL